jgi:hypothetical protein
VFGLSILSLLDLFRAATSQGWAMYSDFLFFKVHANFFDIRAQLHQPSRHQAHPTIPQLEQQQATIAKAKPAKRESSHTVM